MSDGVVIVPPDGTGKAIDNAVFSRGGIDVYRQRVEVYGPNEALEVPVSGPLTDAELRNAPVPVSGPLTDAELRLSPVLTTVGDFSLDTSGRLRISKPTTLFDGRISGAEDVNKWDTKGTGTATYSDNKVALSVTAGQYVIRQGKFFCPYFSGKNQLIETTFINFQNEAGVVKRVGYFSSNGVAPYDSNKDGLWLEADGSTYRFIISNNGVETHNIPWTSWDAYSEISSYDWSKFTVNEIDFLWLGGAAARLFLVINGEFKLVHTVRTHAGYSTSLITQTANQPVRYEIRSTSGSGSLVSVCSQVATEGITSTEQAQGVTIYTPPIACNVVGTVYALAAMRKTPAYRSNHVALDYFGVTIISNQIESGMLLLMLNPTFSAPLTWTSTSRIETALATTQKITNTGRVLRAIPTSSSSITAQAPQAMLRNLAVDIDNTMGVLAVGYTPFTATQNVAGSLMAMEY